ncbi:MAG: aminotransferase class III-fold pyridoxal phosphate-dependent enzyme [Glaciimonas sp.]|nr:aminotransferase class III-fold pyridoxal phosphate-dependent enzyme [Glaciimonas sp.]
MDTQHLIDMDRAHWIHPVSVWRKQEKQGVTILRSAKGAYITDIDGHTLLDGFSGLWCVNLGYGHESIVRAATEQMQRLPYATGYFNYGSEPAIELAAKLAQLAPGDLDHVFFTMGGSDAIDTTVRLICYYFNTIGKPEKKQFISLQRGYHGSSAIGSGLTALSAFHRNFDVPLPTQHTISSPYPYRNPIGPDPATIIAASVQELRSKVAEIGAKRVAAFFCEPVQGSGGVIVPPKGWLAAMRQACAELDILFVADEVITGFGRTGPLFACESENVTPDFMTVAKGLTSGYSPMGAVFISDRIYRAIADANPTDMPVGHGLTYSGHPVSAAVGLEALRLYREGGMLENGQKVGAYFEQRLQELSRHPLVGDVRSCGMLAAVELVTDKVRKTKPDKALKIGERLGQAGYRNRLIFRAFSDDIIGFAPPLCCTTSDIDLLIERFQQSLDEIVNIDEILRVVN